MRDKNDNAWFAPKRFGLGSGRPIAWQGWALLALHIGAIMLGVAMLRPSHVAVIAWVLFVTLVPMPLYAAKTRGGWKWRWDRKDRR